MPAGVVLEEFEKHRCAVAQRLLREVLASPFHHVEDHVGDGVRGDHVRGHRAAVDARCDGLQSRGPRPAGHEFAIQNQAGDSATGEFGGQLLQLGKGPGQILAVAAHEAQTSAAKGTDQSNPVEFDLKCPLRPRGQGSGGGEHGAHGAMLS